MRLFYALVFVCASASSAAAQAFVNAGSSLANYSVASTSPSKTCESLSSFKSDGIVSIKVYCCIIGSGWIKRSRRAFIYNCCSVCQDAI